MVLKHECVRETLLYLEKNLTFDTPIYSPNIQLKHFSSEDINYTIAKLKEAGYINAVYSGADNIPSYLIQSLTWDGHQFLDNIRDNAVWKKTKSILSKIKSTSLEISAQVASMVILNMLGF